MSRLMRRKVSRQRGWCVCRPFSVLCGLDRAAHRLKIRAGRLCDAHDKVIWKRLGT